MNLLITTLLSILCYFETNPVAVKEYDDDDGICKTFGLWTLSTLEIRVFNNVKYTVGGSTG